MRIPIWAALMWSLFAASGCGKDPAAPQPPKFVIAEAAPPASDSGSPLYAAVIRARIEAIQAFRVGGRIHSRLVDMGDIVKKGQVLATLDPTDWDLNVKALRGQLEAATAQRDNARTDLERFRDLTAQKLMSEAELDRQQHAVAAAEGQVAALTAQTQEATEKLAYTELRADADGVVTKVMAEPGQVASEGTPILVVARTAELEVEFSLPEHRLKDVRVGQTIQVSLWSEPGARLSARVRAIAPAADPVTRTFQVRATLVHPQPAAAIGMTASVWIGAGESVSPIVNLPVAAVFEREGVKAVWVVDAAAGTLRLAPVKVGGVTANRYLVTRGVKPGELVVIAGVHRLTATDHVAIYSGGEQPARSAADR